MEPVYLVGSADDACGLLETLRQNEKPESTRQGLIHILIYLRTKHAYSGNRTESIAGLETQVISFLNDYRDDNFEETYSILREIIALIPKFYIFGIDIIELRTITHDFDAACRYDPVFKSIAADIRRLVHQHLSDKVITKIAQLEEFLRSENSSALVDGSVIAGASARDKEDLLHSPLFDQLLLLKEKLKIAWSHKTSQPLSGAAVQEFYAAIRMLMDSLPHQELAALPSYQMFQSFANESGNWEERAVGKTRYHLYRLIMEAARSSLAAKGTILFRLITLDVLLERASFIYYSNLVNSVMREIDDSNYLDGLAIMGNLALCTRAAGHGNINLLRFALLLENLLGQLHSRPDRTTHFPTLVDAMHAALENSIAHLQNLYAEQLQSWEKPLINRIFNNLIREKTTHLLGNLINNISKYLDRKKLEPYQRIQRQLGSSSLVAIKDLVFKFGSDINEHYGELEGPEFMGGKGFSQIANARIIVNNRLPCMEVPKGAGFSTLTWSCIKQSPQRLAEFRRELRTVVDTIEVRTAKKFGDPQRPLLLMARSGGVFSMPGVLDTISHIGIDAGIAAAWAQNLEEPGRAYQAWISFLLSYAKSVLGLSPGAVLRAAGVAKYEALYDRAPASIRSAAENIREVIGLQSGRGDAAIPDDLFEQLYTSTIAVFNTYENEIVLKQARNYGIPDQFQTACLIQECLPVLSPRDCSGVFFTRNPNTGRIGSAYAEQIEFGEGFFGNVIADGIVSPAGIREFTEHYREHYELLTRFKYFDEREQRYPTDIEFAIRNNTLYIVQSRVLKQSPIALIVNSYDFYCERIYSEFKLIKRTAFSLNKQIRQTYLDRKETQNKPVIVMGKPVNGGAVRGRLVLNQGSIGAFDGPLIFLAETNVPPKIIMQENTVAGYISKEGGITSHAALVAIAEKKPCMTDVNWERGEQKDDIILGGFHLKEGDFITLDANTGNIYREEIPIIESGVIDAEFAGIRDAIVGVLDTVISAEVDG